MVSGRSRPRKAVAGIHRGKSLRAAGPGERVLFWKIRSLPPERLVEVEDFVEFLATRTGDRHLSADALTLSGDTFGRIWDNAEDSVYDDL